MSKKNITRLRMLLLLISFLMIIISSSFALKIIEIRIWSDKREYLIREPILIHYEVKNRSNSMIVLSYGLFDDYFKINDEKGHSYANMFLVQYALTDTLKPNEFHRGSANISDRYRIIDALDYTISMETPNGGILPVTRSNITKIKVKNPIGDEKKALDIFLEAERLEWARDKDGKKDFTTRELGFQKYLDLVDKYPKSVYAPLSLASARGVYRYSTNLEERKKIIPISKKLIEKYPNSLYFSSAFMSLVDVYEILKDKTGAIQSMNELIKKHPNTKISEKAEYWLQKIEKWKF